MTTTMIQTTATTPASVGVNQPGEDAAQQDDRNHQRQRGVLGRERDGEKDARGRRMPTGPKK